VDTSCRKVIFKQGIILMKRIFFLIGFLFVFSCCPSMGVETWKRWETTLTSSEIYANPFLDHDLKVTYTSPTGRTYTSYGFWDGGTTFKIRFMFNEPGRWDWQTTFSDTSNNLLHHRSGSVQVMSYRGDNPLYKYGYLRVSDNKRYLAHSDGTPFLLIADTAWTAYIYATDSEWRQYIDDRSRKRINTVLMSSCCVTRNERSKDAEGEVFFPNRSPLRIKPAAWRYLDQKVQYANDNGILMVITGLLTGGVVGNAEAHEVDAFVKMLSARLVGNHVILSPMQDWGTFHWERHHIVGNAIREVLPFHLITQHLRRNSDRKNPDTHPGLTTGAQWALHFHHDSYLDFSGIQTGHGALLADGEPLNDDQKMNLAAKDHIRWIDQVYEEKPHKPVVVLEGMYELNEGTESVENSRAMVRRQGYWSFLNGACGYASSCQAIWGWGRINIGWTEPPIKCPPVSDGLDCVYATYLMYMADFFSRIEWWTLEPDHEHLIQNQAADYRQRMLLAKSGDNRLAVAYLPDNKQIAIDMSGFSSPMKATWYRTTSGTYRNVPNTAMNRGIHVFEKPTGWQDAVILLENGEE
jgi:hypothetical protein